MYYILEGGSQLGPYTLNQMRVMWANGSLSATALCWAEGMANWEPVERHVILAVQHNPVQRSTKLTIAPNGDLCLDNIKLVPASGARRFVSFIFDIVLTLFLMFKIPGWLGLYKDPGASIAPVVILFICAIAKDVPFGGRSLGRFLTRSYLIDVPKAEVAKALRSMTRNSILVLYLFGPWLALAVLGLLMPWFSALAFPFAIGYNAYLVALLLSRDNESGQGHWDMPLGTRVMTKGKI
jgi:hypothetical protein